MAPPPGLNVVRQYVAYGAEEMPSVELLVVNGHAGEATWMPGQVRMHTCHQDGTTTITAQYLHRGRLLVDNFTEGLVRPL